MGICGAGGGVGGAGGEGKVLEGPTRTILHCNYMRHYVAVCVCGVGGGVGGAGGEGKVLEGVMQEELRFEAEEAAKAHGGAGQSAAITVGVVLMSLYGQGSL